MLAQTTKKNEIFIYLYIYYICLQKHHLKQQQQQQQNQEIAKLCKSCAEKFGVFFLPLFYFYFDIPFIFTTFLQYLALGMCILYCCTFNDGKYPYIQISIMVLYKIHLHRYI